MLTMAMLVHILSEAPTGGSPSLDNVYYILACIALIIGFVEGLRRFLLRQRKKWIDEGKEKERAIRAQEDNSTKLDANTEAIGKLTVQMTEFMTSVHSELTNVRSGLKGLGDRVLELEHFNKRGGK